MGYSCFDCPNCYPKGPLGHCRGKVTSLAGGLQHQRFATLANYTFKLQSADVGWWTDVVCVAPDFREAGKNKARPQ